jgi:glutathione peroxidase-family protein
LITIIKNKNMKQISVYTAVLLLAGSFWTTSIYTFSFTKIEGGTQPVSAYQGKKILIVTLPVVQTAFGDSMLYSLDTLGTAHAGTLRIIGVPSFEDGYTAALKPQLELWYRSKLGNQITIAEGLYSRKTSGTQQHALFRWLTDVNQNENFDMDVTGPGYKFFVNASGQLYGVLQPHTKISGLSVQKTLNLQ